ncbi:aminotransferase class V-fold PLP-dependent enzyme [Candidatus Bathyarchaeota archaeon]|nr:aminotransferase class V-fold PLP-dependent enzyme [Candidatus Bathyarchaeota archaeon]
MAASVLENIPPLPMNDDPDYWGELRKQFPMPSDEAYCNTGTVGASPLRVLKAVFDHTIQSNVRAAHVDWSGGGMSLLSGYGAYVGLREKVGMLINADYRLVSLTQNATMGMNLLAGGLDIPEGAEVLTTDIEHPGGRGAWELHAERKGSKHRKVEIPRSIDGPAEIVAAFEKAITPDTHLLSFPHISSEQGIVFPAKQICELAKERGIISVVDGAQTPGHIRIDVEKLGCDAYYGSPHKWLMAPAGNGFLYVKESLINKVWTTLASSQWDNHEDNGYRLGQRGTGNPSLLVGFEAALDLHFEIGPQRVYDRIRDLGGRLRAGLAIMGEVEIVTPLDSMCAGLTTFKVHGVEDKEVQNQLWKRGKIQPRALSEGRGIRFSTHIYNSEDEVDRTLAILNDLL